MLQPLQNSRIYSSVYPDTFFFRRRTVVATRAAPAVREATEESPQSSDAHASENGWALQAAESPELRAESGAHRAVFAPEDFQLEAGVPCTIDRDSPASPLDVFRCPSCTEPACQVPLGLRHWISGQVLSHCTQPRLGAVHICAGFSSLRKAA